MFGGTDRVVQTTRQEIPEELKPYVTKAIEALTGAISVYPITPLYQFLPRQVIGPSQLQNLIAAQLMTMPFGGISPYIDNLSSIFSPMPSLPQFWSTPDSSGTFTPLPGIENLIAQLENLRREIETLKQSLTATSDASQYYGSH